MMIRKVGQWLAIFILGYSFLDNCDAKAQSLYHRVNKAKRSFSSVSVDSVVDWAKQKIKDPKLSAMFEACYPNTLDTTVKFSIDSTGQPITFVITGDINAMWLRDSSAQVWAYLPLLSRDIHLKDMVKGLIRSHINCLLIDPYANAFNEKPIGSYWETDHTQKMSKYLHERKWELDSPCYTIRLANGYYKETGDSTIFDKKFWQAMKLVVSVMREQQRKTSLGSYSFMRDGDRPTDSHINGGYGSPVKPIGMIYSAFRPSDDATIFGFLVPSNMFAVVSLRQLSVLAKRFCTDNSFYKNCNLLADEVDRAIQKYAVINTPKYGKVYAYEIDGYGGVVVMDDANIPSLLSAPYIGYCKKNDPIYKNTRKLILSTDNPYYFSGKVASGIGSPHVGLGYIWDMSIIMQALTTTDIKEKRKLIYELMKTDAETFFMHESFNKDNAKDFTRNWFAWANSLFGELVLDYLYQKDNNY